MGAAWSSPALVSGAGRTLRRAMKGGTVPEQPGHSRNRAACLSSFPMSPSSTAGRRAQGWKPGQGSMAGEDGAMWRSVRRERENKGGKKKKKKTDKTPFMPLISKQMLGPVFPALKDFIYLFIY